jgi:hypothetical protein
VGLLAIVVGLAELENEAWWSEARLRPYSEQVAQGILYYADLGSRYIESGDASADMDEIL